MEKTWRIILDGAHPAQYNMAMDEALIDSYRLNTVPTLRIYRWHPFAVSLGFAQAADDVVDRAKMQEDGIDLVRRLTGGGAIFHADEITYSIVCGVDDLPLPRGVKQSYRVLNSFLLLFFCRLGIDARFASSDGVATGHRHPFCYCSTEPYDIVYKGRKLGGNAQRRQRSLIFQHGSIPLSVDYDLIRRYVRLSGYNPFHSAAGLAQVCPQAPALEALPGLLADCFRDSFPVKARMQPISRQELQSSAVLIRTKYAAVWWNRCRAHAKQ